MKLHLLAALMIGAPLAAQEPGTLTTLAAADLAWAEATATSPATASAGHLADDVVYLHPGAPVVRGRAEVEGLLQSGARLRWQMLRAAVSADGRAGATFGVLATAEAGAPVLGRYIAFWRHEQGAWRVAALMRALPGIPSAEARTSFRPDTVGTGLRGEVERADRAFAAQGAAAGAAAAFAGAAAPDAMMFGGAGELMIGPEEIGGAFGGPASWAWRPVASGGSADLGFTVGEAEITVPLANGSRVVHTKYLTVWQRQADGNWKFLTDGGNARPAP